jgi:Luciferase
MYLDELPARAGDRPQTTASAPHTQLDQNAPVELQHRLRDYALSLPGVRKGRSGVSVPGAVAFFLDRPAGEPTVPDLFGGEWGHIHPSYDGSLHLNLPTADAERLIERGWAEYHYAVAQDWVPPIVVMLYGPRNEAELEIAKHVVRMAYLAAGGIVTGETTQIPGPPAAV